MPTPRPRIAGGAEPDRRRRSSGSDGSNRARALASYAQARVLLDRLATSDPRKRHVPRVDRGELPPWHRQGPVSHRPRGRVSGVARAGSARSARSWPDANPDGTQYQSDLAVTYHEIGSIQRASGDRVHALRLLVRVPRAIRQKLAGYNPSVTQFQSDPGIKPITTSAFCSKSPAIWAPGGSHRFEGLRRRSCSGWPTSTPPSLSSRVTWHRATR